MLTVYALLLQDEELSLSKKAAPKKPPESMMKQLGLALKSIVILRQSAYTTTIAEDHNLLEIGSTKGRYRMATEVRLGEKEILALAAAHCDRHYISNESAAEENRNTAHAKRMKI